MPQAKGKGMEITMENENKLLSVRNLEVSYDGKSVLNNINLSVNRGEIVGIVGESGSGKSTLLRTIMRLLGSGGVVNRGDILFEDTSVLQLNSTGLRKLRGEKIGMIFQNCKDSLCPVRTIERQLYEMVYQHRKESKLAIRAEAIELLEKLNFDNPNKILKSYPFELSGGMNQRVGIMMAMMLKPKLLLADEPTSALDIMAQSKFLDEIRRIREDYQTAILFVTHNIDVITAIADSVIVMKDGNVAESGKVGTVIHNSANEHTRQLIMATPLGKHCEIEMAVGAENILELKGVSKTFVSNSGKNVAVSDISFSLKRGECLGIVGESGCGKTTITKIITGLLKPDTGNIKLNGKMINPWKRKIKRDLHRYVQLVFQNPVESFNPRMRIGEAIMESMINDGVTKREARQKLNILLKQCSLPIEYANRYPHQISGGECQRASIARAIACNPQILICDEATSALDMTVQKQILDLIKKLRKEINISILFISHDIAVVQQMCDRVLTIN